MITAICFKCGAGKPEPLASCVACKRRPGTADELALSMFLSTRFLPGAKLGEAARLIHRGVPASFPPVLRQRLLAVASELSSAPATALPPRIPEKSKTPKPALVGGTLLVLLLLAGALFQPWPQFQIAHWKGTETAYEKFGQRFPESKLAPRAKERLRKLREDSVWAQASTALSAQPLRDYLRVYPDGKHLAEAHAALSQLAESQWLAVVTNGTESQLRTFLREFSDSPRVPEAKQRLVEVQDENEWYETVAATNLFRLRDFIGEHPGSRFLGDAQKEMQRLSLERWQKFAASRSATELVELRNKSSGTPLEKLAQQQLDDLHFDLIWLAQQNSLSAYQRHLELYPNSPHRSQVEKAIIDMEVAGIMAGNHGKLPPSVPVGGSYSASGQAEVTLRNDTAYELTIRYSGAESRKVVLPARGQQTIHLSPGGYYVTASANALRVVDYGGSETLRAAIYENSFYIGSRAIPEFGLPLPSKIDPIRFWR